MKVKITSTPAGYFSYECVKYHVGDVLEISESGFTAEFMVLVEEPTVAVQVPEPVVEPASEVEVKPKRRRRTVA